ncbi:MAG: pantoate--beta-alanine ligase [Bacteroidales bacterium]|nr:pantoate--beta-alanine ligase [Bacteroidales bacterium]
MEIFNTIADIQQYLNTSWSNNISIGFVPTMGALHEGHLSLFKAASEENKLVVGSIFVNPIQFNNKNDLKNYPGDINKDIDKLMKVKCDVLFFPSEEEMYPEPDNTVYDFGNLDKIMEGKHRPGHFNGVAAVVRKLFEIIKPTRAYFGLKDFQQLMIIMKLVRDIQLPVEIVPCPIIREKGGLAMSSRNVLLSGTERKSAILINKTLRRIKVHAGYSSISEVKEMVKTAFRKDKVMELEYFEIVDMHTLKPLSFWADGKYVIACIAAYAGKVRLIDNFVLFS